VLITVILPTYNRKNSLEIILRQLFSQDMDKTINIIIIVINDGSSDGTTGMLNMEFPNTIVITGTGNWWYTKCMNEGFKIAKKFNPDYVLTLNDDIEIETNYITELLKASNNVGSNSIVGSISITKEDNAVIFTSGVKKIIAWRMKQIHYIKPFTIIKKEKLTGCYPTQVLPGRGMLIPFRILEKMNYFDETFVQYHSDTDFCYRAVKKRIKLFISWDAQIYLKIYSTSKSSSFIRKTFYEFLKYWFNSYSKSNLKNRILVSYRYTNIIYIPIISIVIILADIKNYFKTKYKNNEVNN
jgi:GT2 family glycosyltransferase